MGRLIEEICVSLPVYDEGKAEADFERLLDVANGSADLAELSVMLGEQDKTGQRLRSVLKGVFGASPYLSNVIFSDVPLLLRLLRSEPVSLFPEFCEELDTDILQARSFDQASACLRAYKRRVALLCALCDVGGVWDVLRMTGTLSDCAGKALSGASRFLLRLAAEKGDYLPRYRDDPEVESGLIILGLGKLGARELNYSSDIDIIIFFDGARVSLADGVLPQQFFVQLTKDLVKLMQERTRFGYVFRTDLRLRPDPGATQVALSTDAAFIYYEGLGQNWERAAMIKARPVAGDIEAGQSFLDGLAPFVWRKYLDFAAIADVHAMKRQINSVRGHGEIAFAGHNIKLGRGGIREIEFFVQTQQLIAGGRQQNLRVRSTIEALSGLLENGWIGEDAVEELSSAYRFMRFVEHRLQMVADEQTHSLPSSDEELLRIARFSGFDTVDDFADELRGHLLNVQKHYAALFEADPALAAEQGSLVFTGDAPDPDTLRTLEEMRFPDPRLVIDTVKKWHFGRYPATRSERAREALTELQPALLAALGDSVDPHSALLAFDRFLEALPTGIQLFSLLKNNPPLLTLIARIMGSAPRLSSILSRRANLIDAVLDPGFFGNVPTKDNLKEMVTDRIAVCDNYQDSLDLARDIGQEQSFLVGARVLSGTVNAEEAGFAFSRLGESLLESLSRKVSAELEEAHGRIEGAFTSVIAMGKLGSEEMSAASDLDLIVIYDVENDQQMSDGARALSAPQYYVRFTQRLVSALTAQTASGRLYEVDMRLRPSGNAGPVATSLRGFKDYQFERAWTWEHMALTRARVVAGPPALRCEIEDIIHDVLVQKRNESTLVSDILEMRQRIWEANATEDVWALKYVRGGLIDVEFLAQYLQLRYAHLGGDILQRRADLVFQKARASEYIRAEHSDVLLGASVLYRSLLQILGLCIGQKLDPSRAPDGLKYLLSQSVGEPDFERLELRLRETQNSVMRVFEAYFSSDLD